MEILQHKSTISEIKHSLSGALQQNGNNRGVYKLENRSVEITQTEEQKLACWMIAEDIKFVSLESQKSKTKRLMQKILLKKQQL